MGAGAILFWRKGEAFDAHLHRGWIITKAALKLSAYIIHRFRDSF